MRERPKARLEFIQKAMDGEFTPAQAKAELDRMEAKYGKLIFTPGKAPRKPRPWTKQDLEGLWQKAICGAGSRDFLEYMAEMGWEIKRAERRQKIIQIFGILAAVVAVVAIIMAIVRLLRS